MAAFAGILVAWLRVWRDNHCMATLPAYDDPRLALVSVREYLATSYRPDCDYVDGRIEERNVGEYDHGSLQTLLAHLFMNHREEWGVRPLTDVRMQVSSRHFRVPDLVVLRQGVPKEPVLTHPPLLVIEILSPEDRLGDFRTALTTTWASASKIFGSLILSDVPPTALHARACTSSKPPNSPCRRRLSGLC
jgi:hypothetical protein